MCGPNLPSQSRDELLKCQAALCVGEDGADVLLSWGHIQDCHLVNLSAREGGEGRAATVAMHSILVRCVWGRTHTSSIKCVG